MRFLAALPVLLLACLVADVAWAASCPPRPGQVAVVFNTEFAEPRYDNSLGQRQISAVVRRADGYQESARGRHFAGLTHGNYRSSIRVGVAMLEQARGGACVWLTEVLGTVRYEGLTVYVDRAYRPGSCPYEEILAHEREHVDIIRKVFNRYRPKLRERLEAKARSMKPFWVARGKTAARKAVERLNLALKPVLDAMNREMHRSHERIDTDANYQRISARCNSW